LVINRLKYNKLKLIFILIAMTLSIGFSKKYSTEEIFSNLNFEKLNADVTIVYEVTESSEMIIVI
jgi:hypothetical protein